MDETKQNQSCKKKKKRSHNQETSDDGDLVAKSSSFVSDKKKKIDKEPKIKTPTLFESKPSSNKKKKSKKDDDQIIVQCDPAAKTLILNEKKKKKKKNLKETKKLVAKRTSIQGENDSSSEPSYEKEFNFRDYYISDIDEDEGYDPMADPNLPDSSSPSLIDMTIIVKGLDISLGENDLRAMLQNHFSQCGKIVCITIPPSDKRFAHISFYDFEACKKALALNQSKLGGMRLTVEMGEEIWEPETTSTPKSSGSKTVQVGNLDSKALESDLQEIFKSAGTIVKVRFEGFARVEFESAKAARKALKLNMIELQGRQPMKVDLLP